ncbi:hypothetical protein PENSPDRAFT_659064 [Peniophora sp. CONT]|nr:hypothetical protein PENSPDRAFT_659064 [Peniophora sp. CONT]
MCLQLVLDGMRVYKSTYDDAMQNIGGKQGYHQYFGGPMTVEEQCVSTQHVSPAS